ncbi:MAG: hypothetical protein KUL86_11345, partial [Castellaniella sp.]|nr:hypothetical protein [Castellaniella sp.]
QSLFVLHWFVSCRVAPGTGCARLKHDNSSKNPAISFYAEQLCFYPCIQFRTGFSEDRISA